MIKETIDATLVEQSNIKRRKKTHDENESNQRKEIVGFQKRK